MIGSELLLRALDAARTDRGRGVTVEELAADIGLPAMFSAVIGKALRAELEAGRVEEHANGFTLTEAGRRFAAAADAGEALPDSPSAA